MKASPLPVPILEHDDVGFIHLVREVLADEWTVPTSEAYLVKIDHWFGRRWFRFSGTKLGALSFWHDRAGVPPFHPHRVLSERHFSRDEGGRYVEGPAPAPLHLHQGGDDNLVRCLHTISRSATFVWYSGDTSRTGRGSVMLYAVTDEDQSKLYAECIRTRAGWTLTGPARGDERAPAELRARSTRRRTPRQLAPRG